MNVTAVLAPCENFSRRQTPGKRPPKVSPLYKDPSVHENACVHPVVRGGNVESCSAKCRKGKHGWACDKHYWLTRPRIAR